jgi:hypothetical protein
MTNDETQMTKHETEMRPWDFVISSSFEFRHSSFFLLLAAGLFALSGASCPHTLQHYTNPLPRVLPPSPTLEQVIDVVNRNSSQIRSFSTNHAAVSGTGFPSLGASVAFERAKRFRLQAGTGVTGTEFDLGSNDELFWFWLRRSQPPALYYCRHDQFPSSPASQTTPFEPGWLIDALGVMEFDPALPHQGPIALPNDRLRIDTIRNTPQGPEATVTIIDGSQGWVLEQHKFDANKRLIARSIASDHRRDPLTGLVMPKVVSITCPPAQLDMRIDLGNVEINRLAADPAALWSMPNYPGSPLVNLADPNSMPPAASSARRPMPQNTWQRPGR